MPTKVLFLTTYSHSTSVVGESNYQENIQRVIGFIDDDREPVREEGFTAELVLEDDNPYDSGNAVRIDIDGCTIGYLSRDDAAMYRRSLSLLRLDDRVIGMCSAVISGKWNDEVESLLFGVYLDLDTSRLSILRKVEESPQPHKTESSKEMQQEIQPTKPQSKLPLIPMKGSGCLYFLLVFPFVAVINLYILLFAGLWRGGQWLWKNATATPTSRKVSAIAAGILSVSGILYSAVAGFSGSKVIPTPTLDMVSLQNTAMAEAWIAYTQTMLANATDTPIPTDTLQPTLPPTETAQPLPTATQIVVITDTPFFLGLPANQPTATSSVSGGSCPCNGDTLNCTDFVYQSSAQSCYNYCVSIGAGDIHRLDNDGDGEACESLP